MPVVLEQLHARQSTRTPRLSRARRVVTGMVRLTIFVLIISILAGGYYLARRGFGREWRYRVVTELHKHGVEAQIGRLTLDPFRGLVAKNVKIFDYRNRENTIALISQVALDINYAALIHNEAFLNALDIRDAQITFPLKTAEAKATRAQVSNLRAHIYFPPEQIYVSQAEGIFCGIRVSARGQLIRRDNYQPSASTTAEEWKNRLSLAQRAVVELQKFSFPAAAPSLQLNFSGDIAELENARVEATLNGERLRRGSYQIDNLSVAVDWNNQRLSISHCEWSDSKGTIAARGDWKRQTNAAKFQIHSTLDLTGLLDAFGVDGPMADVHFDSPPLFEVTGSVDFANAQFHPHIVGHAASAQFTYKKAPFSDLSADFSWDGERTFVRELRVRHQSGWLRADLLDAPNDFRLNLESTLSPEAVRPLLPSQANNFLREWQWQRSPAFRMAIRGTDRDPGNWQGDGTVALGRTRFRGTWMNGASARIHFADGAVTCESLQVMRNEGTGSGSFAYDFKKHELRISNVRSSLYPAEAIFWIDPRSSKNVTPYKFRRPPNVVANGVYQFRGGKNTRLEINVDGASGMDYVFLGKTLPFDRITARLVFTNERLQISDIRAELLSGTFRGDADISLARNDPRYRANLSLSEINFPRLTELFFNYKTAQGLLRATYEFNGVGSDWRTMRGNGKVEVSNGDVFAIPIFGPLSGILNHIVPGSGYSIARKANANFTVENGTIHTDDFEAAGSLFSMLGNGDIHFLDDQLDFNLRMDMKGPGIVLMPMYKLFEYVGEGSLKKPDWHPKRF